MLQVLFEFGAMGPSPAIWLRTKNEFVIKNFPNLKNRTKWFEMKTVWLLQLLQWSETILSFRGLYNHQQKSHSFLYEEVWSKKKYSLAPIVTYMYVTFWVFRCGTLWPSGSEHEKILWYRKYKTIGLSKCPMMRMQFFFRIRLSLRLE